MSSEPPADSTARLEALDLLTETFDREDCPKCDLREEFGLVLGDGDCAIGVAVCPNCGYHSRCLTADTAGVATDHPYKHMVTLAMDWVPDWHPGREDVTCDWRCTCGQVWQTSEAAHIHIYQEHPDDTRTTLVEHDRYPWDNISHGGGRRE